MMSKIYLGDSVYAEWYGSCVKLTTENGEAHGPTNMIYLEGEVLDALYKFVQTMHDCEKGPQPR